MDIASSIQLVLEEIILLLSKNLQKEYRLQNLCLAGVFALNCLANVKLLKKVYFIINCFADEKIYNYKKYYFNQLKNIEHLKKIAFYTKTQKNKKIHTNKKIKVKSNVSKKVFKKIILKAKEYIKKVDPECLVSFFKIFWN